MTDVLADQTPPILQGPSDKEKKYDRQLRLWAANGQRALEDAHILLLNSGSGTVGVETLKNLVLPGIGKFTIAEDTIVEEADLGVNFFLDEDCLGKSRSECCTRLLQELNPDVKGEWWPRMPDSRIQDLLQSDSQFTLIMFSYPIDPQNLELLRKYSDEYKVPLMSIHSAGFYAYFQLHLPGNFPIVDTHPDSTATTDLRLLTPWPELVAFTDSLTSNIEALDTHEHGHIPYLVLLLYYLEQWKKEHNGQPPNSYADKVAFRKMVAQAARKDNPEGGEENYDEAVANVLKNLTAPTLSGSVREVFEYTPESAEAESSFWVITAAVKQFYAKHKELPLPGSVPDMKAQSKTYIQLQNIYKKKARDDITEVLSYIQHATGGKGPTQQEVETYCKNAAFIKLIRGNQLDTANLKSLAESELNAEFAIAPTLIPVYLALVASQNAATLTHSLILKEIAKIMPNAADDERLDQAAQEVARAQGGELHNVGSLVGGMVAQEVIKIITKQYIPIDNTCVFDGITSRSQTFRV